MRRLIIVGAGGFGREVYAWARDIRSNGQTDWDIAGFISDNPHTLDEYRYDAKIIGPILNFIPGKSDVFAMGLGMPKDKLKVAEALERNGAEFINLVHPTAVIGCNVRMGRGVVICPYAVLTCDIDVGNFVTVNACATVGHDAKVGDGSTLCGHVDVTGFAEIGKGAFLGSHSSIIPHAKVGHFSTVGAGSVVVRKTKDYSTVIGVPAKTIKE